MPRIAIYPDDETYAKIAAKASAENRSMNNAALTFLKEALKPAPGLRPPAPSQGRQTADAWPAMGRTPGGS